MRVGGIVAEGLVSLRDQGVDFLGSNGSLCLSGLGLVELF